MSARVLVVEDNPFNRELVCDLLSSADLSVRVASTAEEALALAREGFDLILMDIALPGMDGLEAIRRLKADPRTRDVPVIALTAHAMQGDRERILAAGASGYLAKPIATRTFLDEIRSFLPADVSGPAPRGREGDPRR
jgi:CheY-like chemotaxis protein